MLGSPSIILIILTHFLFLWITYWAGPASRSCGGCLVGCSDSAPSCSTRKYCQIALLIFSTSIFTWYQPVFLSHALGVHIYPQVSVPSHPPARRRYTLPPTHICVSLFSMPLYLSSSSTLRGPQTTLLIIYVHRSDIYCISSSQCVLDYLLYEPSRYWPTSSSVPFGAVYIYIYDLKHWCAL